MKNLFTFEDMTGKRQLRSFSKVTIFALVLIVAIGAVNIVNRHRMMNQVFAEPRPVSAEAFPNADVVVEQPVVEQPVVEQPVVEQPVVEQPVIEQPVVVEECPTDPADWTLTENLSVPGSNLKNLSPECVYNELEKTAAWVYATTSLGYTRTQAAAMLGLQNPQIVLNETINVLTDYKDEPQQVSLRVEAPHPDLAEWLLNADGEIGGVSFTFSGCFRTSSVRGGRWSTGATVIR
jgi:hypothetical protein